MLLVMIIKLLPFLNCLKCHHAKFENDSTFKLTLIIEKLCFCKKEVAGKLPTCLEKAVSSFEAKNRNMHN